MRLRSIEVSGWQCFVEPCALVDLAPGLNVVHAPNGTGKSTLFCALRRALFDKHNVGGEEIGQLRSWGRDVAPIVAITFDHGGASYRLEKQFLDAPRSTLHRREDGRFVPLAEAEKADAFVRELLRSTPPGAGASKGPKHWGIAAIGWVEQGKLALADLEASLAAHVQASLGIEAVGRGGDAIERAIEARYATVYTGQGKLKTGANQARVVALRDLLGELETRRAALVPQAQAFDDASRRVEDLQRERQQARAGEATLARTLDDLRAAAARRRDVEADVERLRSLEAQAGAEHGRARQRIDAIRDARDQHAAAEREHAALALLGPALRDERLAARQRLDDANATLAALRQARGQVAKAAADAELAEAFARAAADVVALGERAATRRAADARLAALRGQVDALRAPTPAVLKQLRRADADRRDARAALDASMITVRLVPTADATIDARVAEQPGVRRATAGEEVVVRGAPEVVVDLPGFGQVRASGPATASIDDRRAALAEAEARLAKLATPFGTADLDEMQRRADADADLRVEIATAEATRAAALGEADAAALDRALARATRDRDAALDARADWRAAPPDAAGLRRAAAERSRAHDRAADEATHARDRCADAWQRAEAASTTHAANLGACLRRATDLAAALDRLSRADGHDDAARQKLADDAALAWHAARAGLSRARAALDALGEDPTPAIERAGRQLAALSASAVELLEKERRADGWLDGVAHGGAYSQLASVDEQIAQAREELAAAEAEASAIRILYDAVRNERARLVRDVAAPVEAIAGDVLRRVAGERLADVRLGDRFAPRTIASSLRVEPIDLTCLSGGEQEQVHLAVRLALAEVLSRGGPQLVVLDDVLTATDAGRFGRMHAVLEDFAQRLQILIFTCHPERYAGLREAKSFDLELLRRSARGAP